MKFPEKIIYETEIEEKWSGFWLFLEQKSHFENPIDLQKKSTPLNLSRRESSFKYPDDYIRSFIFLIKKLAKLVETQQFHQYGLSHSISHQGSYSNFRIRWILRKLELFCLFGWFIMKNQLWPQWKELKNEPLYIVHYVKI